LWPPGFISLDDVANFFGTCDMLRKVTLRVLVVISHLPKDITARPLLPMWTLTSVEAFTGGAL
jgi:hypothetical protein